MVKFWHDELKNNSKEKNIIAIHDHNSQKMVKKQQRRVLCVIFVLFIFDDIYFAFRHSTLAIIAFSVLSSCLAQRIWRIKTQQQRRASVHHSSHVMCVCTCACAESTSSAQTNTQSIIVAYLYSTVKSAVKNKLLADPVCGGCRRRRNIETRRFILFVHCFGIPEILVSHWLTLLLKNFGFVCQLKLKNQSKLKTNDFICGRQTNAISKTTHPIDIRWEPKNK